MKSGYQLRSITNRTHWADGTDVPNGPSVSATYFLGYFREDYEWIDHPDQDDFLDIHNGRFCVTPEYPNGTYAYFATVDENWNSAFPYLVGPTFYGVVNGSKVAAISEPAVVYTSGSVGAEELFLEESGFVFFPNPTQDFLAIQASGLVKADLLLQLTDEQGKVVRTGKIAAGSTISYLDVETLYNGTYYLSISLGSNVITKPIVLVR